MKYKEVLTNLMTELSTDKDTIFIGQQVKYKGNPMSGTLVNVPDIQKIELPIMEDSQMGISIGLSMTGKRVITFYPRWDFLLIASNQLITHADKFNEMTGENLHIIVRVGKGSDNPLDPGSQHKNIYHKEFQSMSKTIKYFDCKNSLDLIRAYEEAKNKKGIYVVTEYPELYESEMDFNIMSYDGDHNGLKSNLFGSIFKKKVIDDFINMCEIENYRVHDKTILEKKPNENFFLIHVSKKYLSEYILENDSLPINSEVKEFLKNNKNLYLIFILPYECDVDNIIDIVDLAIKKDDLPPNQIYVINENLSLKYKNNKNFFTSNLLLRHSSVTLKNSQKSDLIYSDEPKENIFTLHNRRCKAHRLGILLYMKKNNILDECDWSFLSGDLLKDQSSDLFRILITLLRTYIFDPIEFDMYQNELKYFIDIGVKYSKYEITSLIDTDMVHEKIEKFPFWEIYDKNPFINSYVNIVTESQFENEDVTHITEKSLVPLFFCQLPIFISTYKHAHYLKLNYGFDLFSDFIDHSYDEIKDAKERFKTVCGEIKRIHENKNELIKFYSENKDRFLKNRKIVMEIENNKDDVNFLKSLIYRN